MACQQYITETKLFYSNSQTDTNCNSVIFINSGSVNVSVDNVLLAPNQTLAIDGNKDEMLVKVYEFNFAAGSNPQLTVVFKRYIG
jgi:hypothetical protein